MRIAPVIGIGIAAVALLASVRWRWLLVVFVVFCFGLVRGWNAPLVPGKSAPSTNAIVWSLAQTKEWATHAINRSLPRPEAPLASGLLLGSREDLPLELKSAFRSTGTSHIVAVSGYNVTIVVAMIAGVLQRLPLPKWGRTTLMLSAITAFVVLTGASASVVRAGIMGSLVVLARATGRLGDALHTLLVAGCAMVFAEPRVLADVGFQLSMAATLGLMVLSEPIERRLRFVPEALGIRSSLASTLSAILLTQPIILLTFRQVSLVAPIVNLLVLPLVPIAMLTGFSVALIGGIVPALSPFVSWIAWFPLKLIISAVTFGSALPGASLALGSAVAAAIACVWAACVAHFLVVRRQRALA